MRKQLIYEQIYDGSLKQLIYEQIYDGSLKQLIYEQIYDQTNSSSLTFFWATCQTTQTRWFYFFHHRSQINCFKYFAWPECESFRRQQNHNTRPPHSTHCQSLYMNTTRYELLVMALQSVSSLIIIYLKNLVHDAQYLKPVCRSPVLYMKWPRSYALQLSSKFYNTGKCTGHLDMSVLL